MPKPSQRERAEAPRKWKARPAVESKRASVCEDKQIITQSEWERGCRVVPAAFALMLALYAVWEAVA